MKHLLKKWLAKTILDIDVDVSDTTLGGQKGPDETLAKTLVLRMVDVNSKDFEYQECDFYIKNQQAVEYITLRLTYMAEVTRKI